MVLAETFPRAECVETRSRPWRRARRTRVEFIVRPYREEYAPRAPVYVVISALLSSARKASCCHHGQADGRRPDSEECGGPSSLNELALKAAVRETISIGHRTSGSISNTSRFSPARDRARRDKLAIAVAVHPTKQQGWRRSGDDAGLGHADHFFVSCPLQRQIGRPAHVLFRTVGSARQRKVDFCTRQPIRWSVASTLQHSVNHTVNM